MVKMLVRLSYGIKKNIRCVSLNKLSEKVTARETEARTSSAAGRRNEGFKLFGHSQNRYFLSEFVHFDKI